MANGEPKQVIVMRKDLNMRKGKIAAQASHAALGAILNYGKHRPEVEGRNETIDISLQSEPLKEWLAGRFTKVCVSVDSEAELLAIKQHADELGVNVKLIQDAGLTEFGGVPTYTCLAIGPDYPENLDPISGHLKLL